MPYVVSDEANTTLPMPTRVAASSPIMWRDIFVDNAANVLVNVQPDTTKNPDSVLDCPDLYQGTVAGARAKLIEIHCYLPPQ